MDELVRVLAPDELSAITLVQEAIGVFRPELVEFSEDSWEVRFHADRPLPDLRDDVVELVRQWLARSEIPFTVVETAGEPELVSGQPRLRLVTR